MHMYADDHVDVCSHADAHVDVAVDVGLCHFFVRNTKANGMSLFVVMETSNVYFIQVFVFMDMVSADFGSRSGTVPN